MCVPSKFVKPEIGEGGGAAPPHPLLHLRGASPPTPPTGAKIMPIFGFSPNTNLKIKPIFEVNPNMGLIVALEAPVGVLGGEAPQWKYTFINIPDAKPNRTQLRGAAVSRQPPPLALPSDKTLAHECFCSTESHRHHHSSITRSYHTRPAFPRDASRRAIQFCGLLPAGHFERSFALCLFNMRL